MANRQERIEPPPLDLTDKESLRSMYEQERETIRNHGNFQWEGMKFTATLYTALLAFHATALGAYLGFAKDKIAHAVPQGQLKYVGLLLMAAPVAMLLFTTIGWFDLRRETMRLLEQIGILKSLEAVLTLSGKISDDAKKYFKGQPGLLPGRHELTTGYATNEVFVNKKLCAKGSFFVLMTVLHALMFILAAAVACLTWKLVVAGS